MFGRSSLERKQRNQWEQHIKYNYSRYVHEIVGGYCAGNPNNDAQNT